MARREDFTLHSTVSNVMLCAFALSDCTVHIESGSAKYLRAVHRTDPMPLDTNGKTPESFLITLRPAS